MFKSKLRNLLEISFFKQISAWEIRDAACCLNYLHVEDIVSGMENQLNQIVKDNFFYLLLT
jgi:hypothetical protein